MDRCPDCPVEDGVCWPIRHAMPTLCKIPAMRAAIALWGSNGEPEGSAVLVNDGPPADPPTMPVAESIALTRRSAECEHRGCKVGCSKWECSRHGRVVALAECFACLKADDQRFS